MNKPVKVGILAFVGVVLMAVSHMATTYDRGDLAALEQILGVTLLLIATGLYLIKIDEPVTPKPAKKTAEPAKADEAVPPAGEK
jgi:hypothetical protein